MEQHVQDFIREGYGSIGPIIDPVQCTRLKEQIDRERPLSKDLFLDEKEFWDNPRWTKTNPGKGCNLLEKFDLKFIEEHPEFRSTVARVLGKDYEILICKVVRSMPRPYLPDWVYREIKENQVANLGAFVKPEFRDVTYFYGTDWHQDIYGVRPLDFITVYVYLDAVAPDSSPILILPKSHLFGVTVFPHHLIPSAYEPKTWYYSSDKNEVLKNEQICLPGPAGFVAYWHPCTLHGTFPTNEGASRISLRYLIAKKNPQNPGAIDEANAQITGPHMMEMSRVDIEPNGRVTTRGNILQFANSNPAFSGNK